MVYTTVLPGPFPRRNRTRGTMKTTRKLIQLFIALGILDVWLLRYNDPTPYRGGHARNMRQEFKAYGLPPGVMYLVGTSKVALAVCLLIGEWVPSLVRPAAFGMALLMAGAVLMHVKIGDEPKKSVPATIMLLLSSYVAASPE